MATPPNARRDENLAVLCGADPSRSNNGPDPSKLIDPPKKLSDPYGWMRNEDRKDQEVLDHLNAENAYTKTVTGHLESLRTKLYDEMLGFVQETDYTSPKKRGDYVYYTRTIAGKSYKVHCRAPLSSLPSSEPISWDGLASSPILLGEEVILDENLLAEGHSYCSVGSCKPSPSQKFLAYTLDNTGGETYTLYVKNLETGEILETLKGEIDSSVVWGADDNNLFYNIMDESHRPYQFYHHKVGQPITSDSKLFEENDELFWLGCGKSQDGSYIFIESGSKETTEVNYIDLMDESITVKCVAARRPKTLYDVEHRLGKWVITTNHGGLPNMKLVECAAEPDCESNWVDVVDEEGKPLFSGDYVKTLDTVLPLKGHVVAYGREGGIPRVWVAKFNESGKVESFQRLEFEEEAYDVGGGGNLEFDTDDVLISYDSLVTPLQSIKVNLDDLSNRQIIKKKNVPGYDPTKYACARQTVLSRDGSTEIPISIVWNKDLKKPEGEPQHLHLYGYGSYGACMDCYFSPSRLPLLDRGLVYVIAHVRGGGEMGRQWYEEPNGAKYMCKKNTFNDFVDVARYLQDNKMTAPDIMSTEGRSAGGLLIGASVNQAPELFKVAIFGVPFVDVVATMVDATIPLTCVEWEEWGNPNEEKYFQYMSEYSPTNNVRQGGAYPSCLLTGGLHDPRVQFWEPAKMAAELRHQMDSEKSGDICLKMDMTAGHFSASDRYKYYRELAFDWAFVLDKLGLV